MSDKNADGQAGQEVEPVAWRWRPAGAKLWIYDPDQEWLAKQSGIEKEPLYTYPAPSLEGHAAGPACSAPDEALVKRLRDCQSRAIKMSSSSTRLDYDDDLIICKTIDDAIAALTAQGGEQSTVSVPRGVVRFAAMVCEEARDSLGDIDGGWLQDEMEACGLLSPHEVTEPCDSGDCRCEEYGFPTTCYRYTPVANIMFDAAAKDGK